jgi:hypothetical protein
LYLQHIVQHKNEALKHPSFSTNSCPWIELQLPH